MKKRSRKGLSLEQKKGLNGLWYVAPFILGLVFLYITSLVQSFTFSINEIVTGTSGYTLEPRGLYYYNYIFTVDPTFLRTELETIIALLGQIVIVVLYSLFIAVLLNQKMRGRGLVRAIFFLPVILATGIISQIEAQNLTYTVITSGTDAYLREAGIISYSGITSILRSLDMNFNYINYIVDAAEGIYDIVKSSGVQIVILLAGLQSISPSIYEAARVEGCTGWESFWKITLPLISPIIPVCVVWTISESFLNTENPVMTLVLDMAYRSGDYSMSAAMAWINFAAMAVVVSIILAVLNYFVFNENKELTKRGGRR